MSKTFLVNYTKANIFKIGPVRFVPGLNAVTEEQWDAIKNHPLLPFRFKEEHLVWHKGKGPDDYSAPNVKESPATSSTEGTVTNTDDVTALAVDVLASVSQKEAKELVGKTFSVDLLEAWKAKEDRKGVLAAIEEQLKQIHAQQTDKND